MVAIEHPWVYLDLDDLLPIAGNVRLQYLTQPLDLVLQIPCQGQQGSLRHIPGQRYYQHRKQGDINLIDARLVGIRREFDLGQVNLFAHILQCLVAIEAGIKLEQYRGMPLLGGGAHLLDPLDGLQLLLHRPHQQPLGILRRDPLMVHGDIDNGDRHIRLCFLGDSVVGDVATDEQQHQHGKHGAGTAKGGIDKCLHGVSLFRHNDVNPIPGPHKTLTNGDQAYAGR